MAYTGKMSKGKKKKKGEEKKKKKRKNSHHQSVISNTLVGNIKLLNHLRISATLAKWS
jgi:hypothetical protein